MDEKETRRLKIIFLGTPQFAIPCLELLVKSSEEILAVVTKPDVPQGRGRKIISSAVKLFAQGHNLPVFQPQSVNQPFFIEKIAQLKPDLFVVAAFGEILSPKLLEVPGGGGINLHASLLPKYRGGAPINWAIIKGEKKTGVTLMKIEEKLDRGGIILQKGIEISSEDDAISLRDKLSLLGKDALGEGLKLIKRNKVFVQPQNDEEATFAPNLKKEDGLINWDKGAEEIHNLVRGTVPWPGAYTYISLPGGKRNLKIRKTELGEKGLSGKAQSGEIIFLGKDGWKVAAGKGMILVKEVQASGGKKISAYDFALGHRIQTGMRMGK